MFAPACATAARISSALPLPMKVAASGRSRLPRMTPRTSAPADSASRRSSSSSSSARPPPRRNCTSSARSPARAVGCDVNGRLFVSSSLGFCGFGTFKMKLDRPIRNNRGDCVLVDHLAHGVLEQHHELIERFDLSLKLDAVDQKNGYRYMLLAQRVKKRVL